MDTGSSSFGLAATNGTLWVGATETGELLRIDTAARAITARIAVGRAGLDVCATPDAVWAISTLDGTVTRVDAKTNAVTNVVEVGERPYACTWAFGHLWVSNGRSGTLSQVDGDGRVVATVELGGEPNGVAGHGNRIYVAGDLWVPCIESDSIDVIDTATGARRYSLAASKGPIMACRAAQSV